MTPNITLVALTAILYSAGIFLLLERSLTRVLLGVLVLGNATNLLLLSAGGAAGRAPFVGASTPADMSDPLAQAMILTAIVITLAMAALLLALIYRSWLVGRQEHASGVDELEDDEEDRRIALLAAEHESSGVDDDLDEGEDDQRDQDNDVEAEPGRQP